MKGGLRSGGDMMKFSSFPCFFHSCSGYLVFVTSFSFSLVTAKSFTLKIVFSLSWLCLHSLLSSSECMEPIPG